MLDEAGPRVAPVHEGVANVMKTELFWRHVTLFDAVDESGEFSIKICAAIRRVKAPPAR